MSNKIIATTWSKIRDKVKTVNSKFAELVDQLDLDDSFVIYEAHYPYGTIIGDEKNFFYPYKDNELSSLKNLPQTISSDLAYAKDSIPMGLVLNNIVELFIRHNKTSIPKTVYHPGSFFALPRELDKVTQATYSNYRSYTLLNLLNMSAGVRSIFSLPSIGDAVKHGYIQKYFGINTKAPKTYSDHWDLFRQITANKKTKCDWDACLLYFSEKWIQYLANDPAWLELKLFLFQSAWKVSSFARSEIYYDYMFSLIQQKRNLKPNPYLADTANHLLKVAIGAHPGFIPATNNHSAPIELLQEVFIEHYGLQYLPVIMQPEIYKQDPNQIMYYSLQHPSTMVFSPKSSKLASTLQQLRELKYITEILFQEMGNNIEYCANTVVANIAKNTNLNFYHNRSDAHKEIELTKNLQNTDNQLSKILYKKGENYAFPEAATFLRGCVQINFSGDK